ncbi:hypothetical protein GGS23DRAFT_554225 [Durotheca rogersii]|uniref:uncharacterized protein n=1 Tax=Durotheca rogersii TaxID=419775 RepID=UPI0022207FAA|nr:uncharacterized protein GGS23DRAFT_554225 [Durotheca rogersii]KAI5865811.1 hypothetical protein GGS23DRAFT_554225 [Durotheca rogersii]
MSQDSSISGCLSRRPLGILESFMFHQRDIGQRVGRDHWAFCIAFRLTFPPSIAKPIPCLRRAWQVLQWQHPALANTISSDSGGPYVTARPLDAESWADDTFVVDHTSTTARDLLRTLLPTPTATCHWLSASSELVLHSSHWRVDGVGVAMLLHQFMGALAQAAQLGPEAPLEALAPDSGRRLSLMPRIDDLSRPSARVGGEQDAFSAAFGEMQAKIARSGPGIGLPIRPGSAESVPGATDSALTRFDAATTAKVMAACRAKKLTITAAIHAAIVRATAGYLQNPPATAFTSVLLVNLRRALDVTATAETEDISTVVGSFFTGLPVCIESVLTKDGKRIKDFDSIADDLGQVYNEDLVRLLTARDGSGLTADLLDLGARYIQQKEKTPRVSVIEGAPPTETPELSSLCMIHKLVQTEYGSGSYERVTVDDIWIGIEIYNRYVQLHAWIWKGELSLGACFNQSFYEKDFVDDFLKRIMEELREGCGVEKLLHGDIHTAKI